MDTIVDLHSVKQALEARDPQVVSLLQALAEKEDSSRTPVRDDAPTFEQFLSDIRTKQFWRKDRAEQEQYRREQIAAFESDTAEVPLSDRQRSYEIILALWETNDDFSRSSVLQIIAEIPLCYGPWKALKRIFKESESANDTEMYGALVARFDSALSQKSHQVSQHTLAYLCRRGWRYLRRLGETMPAVYPDVCTDVLANYTEDVNWPKTWVANHIFYHETGEYGRGQFRFKSRPSTLLKYRAFAESWRRSPRPLFSLLERAQADQVRRFATSALKSDFRTTLRDVEAVWVARLVYVGSPTVDDFVVWILENVPKFEQSSFRELGLHDAVLQLTKSEHAKAQQFAADYIRTHARDMAKEQLIRLVDCESKPVARVARDLLRERDPRKDIGLESWGQLLDSSASDLAIKVLREHFTAKELTADWFRERLLGDREQAFGFASGELTKVHKLKDLSPDYFCGLIETARNRDMDYWELGKVTRFAFSKLDEFAIDHIAIEKLQKLLVISAATNHVQHWVNSGRLKPAQLGADFLKQIAFHPTFRANSVVEAATKESPSAETLDFNEHLSEVILGWMRDVREFSPEDLGFEWLMQLVQRSEPRYHDFAVEIMTKSFLPADFSDEASAKEEPESKSGDEEITIDFEGASFLFTGKLATMTRSEAKAKVTKAGGANSSTVGAKLNYLVIGDEGSPLYGGGRKGSKQVKAESLIDGGAELKIISETAFLQMLTGEQREFSEDAIESGCERLWSMMLDNEADHPLAQFARTYLRRHHPEICLAETDRPVDPGAEIPNSFLTFERMKPLFHDNRRPVREYAMEMAKWEFARWAPPIEGIIRLCESPYNEVRDFVAKALTVDEAPEHRRYRVSPEILTPDAVYSFCESGNAGTRALGMELIERNPRLRLPEELFRLTESPDRNVRGFVVRAFWAMYRDREITTDWKPDPPPVLPAMGAKAKQKAEARAANLGDGAPERPENLPSGLPELSDFLRRALYEIPPGPPEKSTGSTEQKLKPISARQSKLFLIETLRDMAVEDLELAEVVFPLFCDFMNSRGQSEMEACLVAVTRLKKAHPELAVQQDSAVEGDSK